MSILWTNAAAFGWLAALALPIAIHLLVRRQTRVLAFPSLRFLHETALAAFRRRAIQDAALLACRIAVLVLAVAAIAGPIARTASRDRAQAARLSRAIVAIDGQGSAAPGEAFRSQRFERALPADAIAEALRWLDAQPPSAREIAFTGAFRRGSIDAGDLATIPAGVGIRFIAGESATAPREITAPFLTRRNGVLTRVDQRVRLEADATLVVDGPSTALPDDRLRIAAAANDQPLADAALRAALAEGVPWTGGDRRVLVVWEGGDAAITPAGAGIIRMPLPEPPAAASATWLAIAQHTRQAFVDPVLIPREQLARWSRPAGPPSPDAVPADEGDRRWLWAAALALLGLEHLLRRERARHEVDGAAAAEARVA